MVRKALLEVWERSGCPPGSPRRVSRPTLRFVGPLKVCRPTWWTGRGREAHPEVRVGSGESS